MYIVAKVLYFDKSYPSNGDITGRFEEVNRYLDISSALAKRDFLKNTLSTIERKEDTAIDYVVYRLNTQLYEVRGVTATTQQEKPDGYSKPFANSIPFEVAQAMCQFFNDRNPFYTKELNTLEDAPIKLVMYPSGTFTANNVPT